MTPIGHTLTGLAIGTLAIPREMPRNQKLAALGVFGILASAPDLPFPNWGHDRIVISHSLVSTTVGVMVLGSLLLWRYKGRSPFTPIMVLAGSLAWYSHILLDSMYNHAIGLPILWPLAMVRLALPIPWLAVGDKTNLLSMHNVSVAFYEIITFAPLLILSVIIKKYLLSRSPDERLSAASVAE